MTEQKLEQNSIRMLLCILKRRDFFLWFICNSVNEGGGGGGVEIFGFADLANFWLGFLFFAPSFSVLVRCAVCGFSDKQSIELQH